TWRGTRAAGIEWRRLAHDHRLVALAGTRPGADCARDEDPRRVLYPCLRGDGDLRQRPQPARVRRTALGAAAPVHVHFRRVAAGLSRSSQAPRQTGARGAESDRRRLAMTCWIVMPRPR